MTNQYLAQLNIAAARDTMESDLMHGFVDRLNEINALAEQSPGFIWRLQTEEGDATLLRVFDNPLLIVNMSVWSNIESLKNYVYKSSHIELIKGREAWFKKMASTQQVLWWISTDRLPSIEEGKNKLALLEKNGPSVEAFTFAKPYF